jgi:hypothetical protein
VWRGPESLTPYFPFADFLPPLDFVFDLLPLDLPFDLLPPDLLLDLLPVDLLLDDLPPLDLLLARLGSFLRFTLAISSSFGSLIDSYMPFEAPRRDDFFVWPRFALRAAPAAFCCCLDFAGMLRPPCTSGPDGLGARPPGVTTASGP